MEKEIPTLRTEIEIFRDHCCEVYHSIHGLNQDPNIVLKSSEFYLGILAGMRERSLEIAGQLGSILKRHPER